jgi:glycosyltransferase involved in cell wall biosynthesis
MRVGVDATCWQNNRGYGRHARALLSSVIALDQQTEYTLVMDSPADPSSLPPCAKVKVLRGNTPTAVAASADGHRSLSDMWRVSHALSTGSYDLVLFPTVYSYVPILTSARKLVIIHDVIAETFPKLTVPRPAARMLWRAKVALGRYQADGLITVSEYSKRGIVSHFGVSPDRVYVVGEASDPIFRPLESAQPTAVLQASGINGEHRLVTYVGGFGPHKNLEALVVAFAELATLPDFDDLRLVMVGEYRKEVFHTEFNKVRQAVETAGIADRVIFTGFIPDEELVVLLNLSTVLVLPSLMEGFGLPAVEAAACGCPVIATRESPLPELLGAGGKYIDPMSDDLRSTLREVVTSPELQRSMKREGLERAQRLSWTAAANQMISVIRRVTA